MTSLSNGGILMVPVNKAFSSKNEPTKAGLSVRLVHFWEGEGSWRALEVLDLEWITILLPFRTLPRPRLVRTHRYSIAEACFAFRLGKMCMQSSPIFF